MNDLYYIYMHICLDMREKSHWHWKERESITWANQKQQCQLDHFLSLSFERSWSSIFARATWLLDKLQLLFNDPNCDFLFKYVRGRLCKWVRFLREHWHNFTHSPTTMHTHTHTHTLACVYVFVHSLASFQCKVNLDLIKAAARRHCHFLCNTFHTQPSSHSLYWLSVCVCD